jgi:hypothetical protein
MEILRKNLELPIPTRRADYEGIGRHALMTYSMPE